MLFKKTVEVLAFADISNSVNFTSIKPTIRSVELDLIVPFLGKELYNSLNSAYTLITDENNLASAQKLLLEQCRYVIGPYLCYYYAPKADVRLSDAGMTRPETGNMKTAYQEQRTDFKEAYLREGEKAVELLLEFLEDNQSSYPEWVNSEAFTDYRSLFIKSGNEFQKSFSSASPFRNYWAMRVKMFDVEENTIKPAIGESLFNYLKSKDLSASGTFTRKEKDLLVKLGKAIAYYTVAFSVPFINVRIDANGITVLSNTAAKRDEDSKRTVAGDPAISLLAISCRESGQTWLNNVLKFLNDNKADFPSWIIPVVSKDNYSINSELRGGFGMC